MYMDFHLDLRNIRMWMIMNNGLLGDSHLLELYDLLQARKHNNIYVLSHIPKEVHLI